MRYLSIIVAILPALVLVVWFAIIYFRRTRRYHGRQIRILHGIGAGQVRTIKRTSFFGRYFITEKEKDKHTHE